MRRCNDCKYFVLHDYITDILGYCSCEPPIDVVYRITFSKLIDATNCKFFEDIE